MTKVIWVVISLNMLALLVFTGAYFVNTLNRNASYEEKGWTIILSIIILLFILSAAIPLYYSKSKGVVIFAGIMAFLPWVIAIVFARLK